MNLRPFSVKVTDWSPFIGRTSPVTPYGFIVVTRHTWICGITISKQWTVSIRLRSVPSISMEIIGVHCSSITETGDFVTASSGALRWKELSSSSPLIRFPDFSLVF